MRTAIIEGTTSPPDTDASSLSCSGLSCWWSPHGLPFDGSLLGIFPLYGPVTELDCFSRESVLFRRCVRLSAGHLIQFGLSQFMLKVGGHHTLHSIDADDHRQGRPRRCDDHHRFAVLLGFCALYGPRAEGMTSSFEKIPARTLVKRGSVARASQPEIGLPDLRLFRDVGAAAVGERATLGNDIGVVAEREREMDVLLDQQDGHPGILERF